MEDDDFWENMMIKISHHPLVRPGIFMIACVAGLVGVMNNILELAILAAILVAISIWFKPSGLSDLDERIVLRDKAKSRSRLILSALLIIFTILAAVGTIFINQSNRINPLSLLAWVGSILFALLAGWAYDDLSVRNLWKSLIKNDSAFIRKLIIEIGLILVVTGLAFLLRVPDLEHYPAMVHGDEGETGLESLRVLGNGMPLGPFETGWSLHPSLFFYFQSTSIILWGQNLTGLRMLSALTGAMCIPLIYMIGRKFWGKVAGFASAWLMAVSHFNIQYSRLGLNNIESLFFMIFFALLILLTFNRQKSEQIVSIGERENTISHQISAQIYMLPLIAIGVIGGIAQYMYLGARFILVEAFLLAVFLIAKKQASIFQFGIISLAAVVVFAPLGIYYLQKPDFFIGRVNTVFIFSQDKITHGSGPSIIWATDSLKILELQFRQVLSMFLQKGDGSSFYFASIPAFDPVTVLFFWLGLGVVGVQLNRFPDFVLFTWFWAGMAFAGLFTIDQPYGARLLMITPSLYLIGGVFLQFIWDKINKFTFMNGFNAFRSLVLRSILLSVLLMGILIFDTYQYFFVFADAEALTLSISLARDIAKEAPLNHVFLMGEGYIYANHGTIRFYTGGNKVVDLFKIDNLPPLVHDGKGIVVIGVGRHVEELKLIQARYPNGVWINSWHQFNNVPFYSSYHIPRLPE
jgi:hypothetical protein